MVDATQVPQANPNGLMPIGAVAAHNIAQALNLDPAHIGTIEQAIKDEINAMSSHFTLAVADVQTQYEVEVLKLKSTYKWAQENKGKVALGVSVVFTVGVLVGSIVTYFVK